MKNKILVTIVDKNDKIIGHKYRDSLSNNDIYRVSALWVVNKKGDILLAQRHHAKLHHPGKWGPAVAGTVEKGETYRQNIIKETHEELGIKNIKPTVGPKTETTGTWRHFTQWYLLQNNLATDQFKIQKTEVQKIKWFSRDELLTDLKTQPQKFLPTMKKYFKLFYARY
ncbi:MAG: NUDIX domain-containing protein [Candidatus Magasanikbacteria bacterium]|jgi:isopentenyl-diphosphate delta-isomerase